MSNSAGIDKTRSFASPTRPVRWQLSIRSLFIGTFAVALLLTVFQFPPLAVLLIVLTEFFAFSACLVCAIYGRGWIQPFSILASLTMLLGYVVLATANLQSPGVAAIFLGMHLILSAAVGLVGAVIHGYLAKHSGFVPVPNVPLLRNFLKNESAQRRATGGDESASDSTCVSEDSALNTPIA